MKVFGEVGIVLLYNKKPKQKYEKKGDIFYFVEYSLNHAGYVFRMNGPRIGRDVKWFNKMTYKVKKKENRIGVESEYKYITTSEVDKIDDETQNETIELKRRITRSMT